MGERQGMHPTGSSQQLLREDFGCSDQGCSRASASRSSAPPRRSRPVRILRDEPRRDEFGPLAASPRALIGRLDRERASRPMNAMDPCNARFGSGSVVPARAGLAQPRRAWTTDEVRDADAAHHDAGWGTTGSQGVTGFRPQTILEQRRLKCPKRGQEFAGHSCGYHRERLPTFYVNSHACATASRHDWQPNQPHRGCRRRSRA